MCHESIFQSHNSLMPPWEAHRVCLIHGRRVVVCCSVAKSRPTLWDPTGCSMPGSPVLHSLPESAQIHAHWVSDAVQLSTPLPSPSPFAFNLSQHQGSVPGRVEGSPRFRKEWYSHFKIIEKYKNKIILCDGWKSYVINILMSLKEGFLEESHICLFAFCLWLLSWERKSNSCYNKGNPWRSTG